MLKLIAAGTVAAAMSVIVAATAVMADADPIAERKQLMKAQGGLTRDLSAMAKGEVPFDRAKVNAAFDAYLNTSGTFAALFPDNTKTGDTKASAKIWEDPAGFRSAIAKFEADAKAAKASVTDLDSFRAAFGKIGQNCQSCHETYRNR